MNEAHPEERHGQQPLGPAVVIDDWALLAIPGLDVDLARAGALVMRSFRNIPNPHLLRRYRGAAVIGGPDRTELLARLERATASLSAPVIAILPPGVAPEPALRGPGVVDLVPAGARDVASRILLMAGVPIVGARRAPAVRAEPPEKEAVRAEAPGARAEPHEEEAVQEAADDGDLEVVAVASSTGGVWVLAAMLRDLPPRGRAVVIAQHMEAEFVPFFADWLRDTSGWRTLLVSGSAPLAAGVACLPAGGLDLVVERGRVRSDAPRGRFVPSADRLLASVAALGARATGVVLSGMGADGAVGLAAVAERGGRALCQAPDSAVVSSMPEAALARTRLAVPVRPGALAGAIAAPRDRPRAETGAGAPR